MLFIRRCYNIFFAQQLIATITHFKRWLVCLFVRTLNASNYYLSVFWFVYFMSWPYRAAQLTVTLLWPRISNLITTDTGPTHTVPLSFSRECRSLYQIRTPRTHSTLLSYITKCYRLECLNLWTETFANQPQIHTIIFATEMKIISGTVRPCEIKINKGNIVKWNKFGFDGIWNFVSNNRNGLTELKKKKK